MMSTIDRPRYEPAEFDSPPAGFDLPHRPGRARWGVIDHQRQVHPQTGQWTREPDDSDVRSFVTEDSAESWIRKQGALDRAGVRT